MKINVKFVIVILLLVAVAFAIEYQMPRRFSWEYSFSHEDDQPFGCMIMDSVLSASMPHGYEVQNSTFREMLEDSTIKVPIGIIALTDQRMADASRAYRLAKRGHVVLLGCSNANDLKDSLHFEVTWRTRFILNEMTGQDAVKGRLRWIGQESGYANHPAVYSVYNKLITERIILDENAVCTPLLQYEMVSANNLSDTCVVAASFPVGKGELIVLSAPLLMTNYTMLDDGSSAVIGRLLDHMKHLHVVRTQRYMQATAHNQISPFYVLLQKPPLRWALYLSVITILLLMVFTARRRQRAIPVVKTPENRNLEFVKLIGSLYWQEHNHADLIKKKLNYTAETVRRETGVDIMDEQAMKTNMDMLVRLTGMDAQRLNDIVVNAKVAATGMYDIGDKELKAHIADLNEMTQNL